MPRPSCSKRACPPSCGFGGLLDPELQVIYVSGYTDGAIVNQTALPQGQRFPAEGSRILPQNGVGAVRQEFACWNP